MLSAQRKRSFHKSSLCYFVSAAAVPLLTTAAMSQEVQEVEELPSIVVEGATLEAPKTRKKTTKQAATAPSQAADAPAAQSSGTGEGTAQTSVDVNGIPIDEIGSAVTVVTGAQLRRQQIRHAADALRSLPGVSVSRSGSFAGLTQVRIRGAEANQTLVLIDGIEANDTTQGEFNFSDLSAVDIVQIEVIRGPQSGLYGSGAAGGVINIITRGGRGPLTFTTRGEGGSFNTQNGTVRISGGNDEFYGSLTLDRQQTSGFNIAPFGSEDDGSSLSTFSFRGGAQLLPGIMLDLTLRRTNKDGDRDTQGFPSGIQIDDPGTFNEKTWLGGARLTWESFGGDLTQTFKATRNETQRQDTDPIFDFITDNLGERIDYSYAGTYRFETPALIAAKHSLTALVTERQEFFTPNSDFGFFGVADGKEIGRNRFSFAGEYRGQFGERLFLTGALRRDEDEAFGDFTTWRTTATVQIPELSLRPHASVGTAVKFPSMFEQFGFIPGIFSGNPNLIPEESFGWDVGVEFTLIPGTALVDITYFEADLTNKIRGSGFSPVNLPGISTRDGIEVGASWQVTRVLSLGASYTYLNAKDPDGVEEIRRPPHSGRFDLNYRFDEDRGNFNVAAIYNGEMTDTNFGTLETVTLDSYWLVNAAASYVVAPGIKILGRVENLLNEDYQEVFGFETPGIAAYVGIRFTYEEPQSIAWSEGRWQKTD